MIKILLTTLCTMFIISCSDNQDSSNEQVDSSTTIESIGSSTKAKPVAGFELKNFDENIRPQDDFYRYINGNWLDKIEIPADRSSYDSFTLVFEENQKRLRTIIENAAADTTAEEGTDKQKIGALYHSFMDTDKVEELGMTPLNSELKHIAAIESKNQLAAYFAAAAKIGVTTPINLGVSQDEKDSTQYITNLAQSGLGLPDRDYYFDESRAEIRTKYIEFIEALLITVADKNAKASADSIMALETELARYHWTRVQKRDADATYNKMSKAEVEKTIPGFNFGAYLKSAEINVSEFNVNHPSYFEGFNTIFEKTPLAVWKSYLRYHLVNSYAAYLPKNVVIANFNFFRKALRGVKEMRPRWKRGVGVVNRSVGFMLGKVYVKEYFSQLAKDRMVKMVANLTSAFDIALSELSWMSEETKVKAKQKLNNFTKKIGYPDIWRDYSALKLKSDDLLGNRMRVKQYDYYRNINRLGQPVDRSEWFMTPQTINAYYNPPMNEIVFPAAILQPPFFNLNSDDAVNYGAIGAAIGHEYGHGFDDQGRKYDKNGNLVDWWTEKDADQFKQRADMLAAQYEKFQVLDGVHVNGRLTLGENIGDLGGLTIAYRAYQLSLNGKEAPVIDGFTGEQRFFIGYTQIWRNKIRDEALKQRITVDPHSPGRYRVIGVLSNMTEFYKAFNVKPGDKMYRPEEQRVKIW